MLQINRKDQIYVGKDECDGKDNSSQTKILKSENVYVYGQSKKHK